MTKRFYLVHPGEALSEILEDRGMSQMELSSRTNLTPKTINEIIRGKANVTPDTATKLALVFGTSVAFWINLQANYEVALENEKITESAAREAALIDDWSFYRELVKLGFVSDVRDSVERVKNLWSFFGVNSLDRMPDVHAVAFRKRNTKASTGLALAAWLRCGEKTSESIVTKKFDKERLLIALERIRAYTTKTGDMEIGPIQSELAEAGVAVAYTPAFPGLGVSGAARWLGPDRALVQISERGKFLDTVWFTLFHEIGHIVRGGKKDSFVDCQETEVDEDEEAANRFAANALIPQSDFRDFVKSGKFGDNAIKSFARKIGVDVSIVAGRLRTHFGEYRALNHLRRKVDIV